ncbi:TatD family hydrolase [Microbacterium gorillae]|uniref:TatD family hydrolase n=1 Tax=Microbacterium gorillae TaxID=1231063 RepID=UPI00058F54C7|nr:TatD family hydrolase [Microbacterium gorillae]
MTTWPPVDMHAHIDPTITPRDLLGLRAVIFAASRSLAESKLGLKRQKQDLLTIWGVGVHPGVHAALERYDPSEFNSLIDQTAYVGEVGLDAKVPSRRARQHDVFASLLTELQAKPRLTSIHSYGATGEVVDHLEQTPVKGVILHWWLGDRADTSRALELGAYFSVNVATLRASAAVDLIPLERLIPETDHPDGNRRGAAPHQPGNVTQVEEALANARGLTAAEVRLQAWRNLAALVATTGTKGLLPSRVAAILDSSV